MFSWVLVLRHLASPVEGPGGSQLKSEPKRRIVQGGGRRAREEPGVGLSGRPLKSGLRELYPGVKSLSVQRMEEV